MKRLKNDDDVEDLISRIILVTLSLSGLSDLYFSSCLCCCADSATLVQLRTWRLDRKGLSHGT